MRFTRTAILAGGAALLVAGTAAFAADKLHTMNVNLPDGSVAHIEYVGKVAPKVMVQPADPVPVAFIDPFAQFDRIAAEMQAQQQALIRQANALEQAAAHAGAGAPGAPGVTLVGDLPAGTHFTYVSSTTDANGCTRTVEYSSDGKSQQPKVTKTSAGSCDAAEPEAAPVTASAAAPAQPQAPGVKV